MTKIRLKKSIAIAALTGTVTIAAAGVVLLNPGPAFPRPRLLSAKPVLAAVVAGSYTIDPMHTSIGFEIEHMGISHVQGRFDTKTGRIVADANDLSKSSVSLTVPIDSIDTNVAMRDKDLKSANYFDAAKYPQMTFQSARIRKDGNNYVADGQLTIRNISKPISIPFRYYGPIQDPRGNTRIGIVCEPVKVHRLDYEIGKNDKLPDGSRSLGNDVIVRLSAEAIADKVAAPAAPPAP